MSELATRVVSALVLAPIALGVIYLGGLPLAVFLAALSAGCAWEFFRLARATGVDPLDPIGVPLAGTLPLAAYSAAVGIYRPSLALPAAALLVVLGAVIWVRGTAGRPLGSAAATILGVLYTGGLLSFGYGLREHPYAVGDRAGTALVAFPLVLTWASDIGAYFVGRTIGGRKLIPAVSPGKTVSGALGGLAVTIIAAWAYVRFVHHDHRRLTPVRRSHQHCGAGRRSRGIVAQAGSEREGQLAPDPGTRRTARPTRQLTVCSSRGLPAVRLAAHCRRAAARPVTVGMATGTRGVALLGSTGSIGTTALRVLERQRDRFRVAALTAFANGGLLEEQAARFAPAFVGLVQNGTSHDARWHTGRSCLVEAATRSDVDIVLNAVVGAAGLDATLAALEAGKRVALANKETLVMAGELASAAAARGGGEIVPVDSEHSAILQCITGRPGNEIRRVILTASGGPFREWPAERLARATVDDALHHPTWQMGRKITVDSATLANKALEVIEAHFLFGLSYDRIDVVVHPQSVVHSLVEFVDGSVLAQLSAPTMELPVLYALTHPERVPDNGVRPFDPVACSPLTQGLIHIYQPTRPY